MSNNDHTCSLGKNDYNLALSNGGDGSIVDNFLAKGALGMNLEHHGYKKNPCLSPPIKVNKAGR
jgi:hypothetical protein